MNTLLVLLCVGAGIGLLVLLLSFICFMLVFFSPTRKPSELEKISIPKGKIYEPHRATMEKWIRETREAPHEDVTITSYDGLKLRGRYYEHTPGAPIELMIHGYRGNSERDMCGGMQRCFALRKNALIVDQRASGRSHGHVITFGIRESRDCLSWVHYIIDRFGPDVKIVLTGISMGAATVLTAAGMSLPKNVIGVLADCGYTSAKDIIETVCRQIHLPPKLIYPFIKLGAKIYGDFDLEELSPVESMKKCKIPVIFFHGEDDAFVPCSMSRENYEACAAPKRLVTVPGAGHGLSCMIDKEGYIRALDEFSQEHGWE